MARPVPKPLQGLALGLGAGLLAWALSAAGLLDSAENLTWDWRARALAAPSPFTSRIKIIALDQASLDWGRVSNGLSWPWPRQVYAPIVEFCARGGAKALALDIIFSEPSPLPGDDEELGRALAAGPPSLGAVMAGQATGAETAWPAGLEGKAVSLDGAAGWRLGPGRGLEMPRALFPVTEIARGFTSLGNVQEEPDADQVIRRVAPLRAFAGRGLLSLGLALARPPASSVQDSRVLSWRPGELLVDGRVVPLDESGRAILRFRGGAGVHQKLSAAAVIQSELRLRQGEEPVLDPALLKDCYVLLGFTAPGLHDLRATPLAPLYPGTEVHATALDNLLAGDFIRPAPPWLAGVLALAWGLCAGVTGMLASRGWHSAAALALLPPLPVLTGLAAYVHGLWLPVAAPSLAALSALVGAAIWSYASEGRQRRFIKRAFHHYLSPQVIERILADPSLLRLGGERRELSIFFSDLAGFTAISERLDPHELAALLNDYLSEMTEIILAEGGTLDKYEGDAIVAFWNAPLDQPDHAPRACRAALACQARLDELQGDLAGRAGAPLRARIGINSGPVVVGNLGSRLRFDYTVLGDAANLASRLEGANKVFGSEVMVSQATRDLAGDMPFLELGLIRVVGRREPVRVFMPLTPEQAADQAGGEAFSHGLDMARQFRWEEAARQFGGCGLAPARVYEERCRQLAAQPGAAWDGVWQLSEK